MERRRVDPRRRGADVDLDDVVYGVHAVSEAISAGEKLRRIHIGDERKRDPALRLLLERAREAQVPVRFESRSFFASFPYKAHQSVVAIGASFEYVSLDEAIAGRKGTGAALFVVLDHITDPHNLGAIIRTAECSGVDAVVIPERRAAGVNATVRKAAAGAAAYVPVARVANVAGAIRTLKKAGLWIAGAAADVEAVDYAAADLARDTALVVGAEGTGLAPLVRRECDYLISIPLEGKVGSLNASVAAGVLLYEALRQRRP
ncbi:MAG TPA: 23S rRNA (guanosine(2251)-2'-O)-methyltransferase RlmB [Candidatus Acidoferrales bacterium]|nr:23S rRNA (guanosine(2251)-2'-O)-methyltransferase RlmB [Candidatus Acidoferrales bacterium]